MLKRTIPITVVFLALGCNAATDYQLETKIRQQQIDQRMQSIQHEMKVQSDQMLSSVSGKSGTTFSPTLPGYSIPTRPSSTSTKVLDPEQVKQFITRLGNPEEGTGIYSYPPEERLYQYGLMCIDVGFVEEGVRAITDHMRIVAENNSKKIQGPGQAR